MILLLLLLILKILEFNLTKFSFKFYNICSLFHFSRELVPQFTYSVGKGILHPFEVKIRLTKCGSYAS